MCQPNQIKIQLLFVRDCPLVAKVRSTIHNCLRKLHAGIAIEELVGDFQSPTLLVNDFDVTGEPPAAEGQAACRLDLPNEEQILAAMLGLPILTCDNEVETDILAAAFRTLLRFGNPVKMQALAREVGQEMDDIITHTKILQHRGHIQLDNEGAIVGAAGLSSIPTKHELSIDGMRLWAWCAFDVLGIFGSLQASGMVRSIDASTNDSLVLSFLNGVLQEADLMVFMADVPGVGSICNDWCSNVNFFRSKSSAEVWSQVNGVTGSLISAGNLAAAAREAWRRNVLRGKN